jgi:hypothetical protein
MWNKFFQFRQFCYKVHIDLKMKSSRSQFAAIGHVVASSKHQNKSNNEKVNRGTLVDGSSTFYY